MARPERAESDRTVQAKEVILPQCIGGTVSVPAASSKANSELGGQPERWLLATGDVQCAAMRLRHTCPNLAERCRLTEPRSRASVTGDQLDFILQTGNPRRLLLGAYRHGENGANMPVDGCVYGSVKDLTKGHNIDDKDLLRDIEESSPESPVEIPDGCVFASDAGPIELSLWQPATCLCLPRVFKIASGILCSHIGDTIFDQDYRDIREGFGSVTDRSLAPDCMPRVRRYGGGPPRPPAWIPASARRPLQRYS